MKKIAFLTLFGLFACAFLAAQNRPPFWEDVEVFRKKDALAAPATGQILFIGSSSFTLWQGVQKDFPDRKIQNRAFGGSTLEDQIRYFSTVVAPLRPRQIVIYCGENDFAQNDTLAVSTVVERFKTLFSMIRKMDRCARVAYVSMKPSPSRAHLLTKYEAANREIEAYLKRKRRTAFIDVFSKMLDEKGQPRPELFGPDLLHMNERGYAIWRAEIEPFLIKN